MFPQLPAQPSTECTFTDTLNSDPFLIFDGTCHKTQSQTNCHIPINFHSRRGQQLPPSILILSTCALTPSVNSFPVIDWQCDKEVPYLYPRRKGIYNYTQSAEDPLTNKAAVNNWPILLPPSELASPITSMSWITRYTRWDSHLYQWSIHE